MDDKKNSLYLIQFGKNLRKIRKSKGYTQAMLANDLDIEISQISRIERGIINTSVLTVHKIASVLGVKEHELFSFKSFTNS